MVVRTRSIQMTIVERYKIHVFFLCHYIRDVIGALEVAGGLLDQIAEVGVGLRL